MTCIVGLEHEGVIYVGGDSAGVDENSLEICTRLDEKVFVLDDFIIGFSGSFRIGQLLRYALVVPDQPSRKDDMAFIVTDFVDAIRTMQKDKGSMTKENELEAHEAGLVVGYNGNLYVIESDFNVLKPADKYVASGLGAPVALGALHATENLNMKPEARIMLALAAAAHFNASVRPPFYILRHPVPESAQ